MRALEREQDRLTQGLTDPGKNLAFTPSETRSLRRVLSRETQSDLNILREFLWRLCGGETGGQERRVGEGYCNSEEER